MNVIRRGRPLTSPLDDSVQMAEVTRVADSENLDNFPPNGDKVPLLLDDSEERSLGDGAEDDVDGLEAVVQIISVDPSNVVPSGVCGRFMNIASVVILTTINLLNYIDRYTVAGKLCSRSPESNEWAGHRVGLC